MSDLPSPADHSPIYTPLAQDQIRVLHIEGSPDVDATLSCRLETVSLLDKPQYAALSYAQGDTTHRTPAIIDNRTVKIAAKLEVALRHMRKTFTGHTAVVWADDICIHQRDLAERSHQVLMMQRIYREASSVYVWLGPAEEHTPAAFDLLHAMHRDTVQFRPYGIRPRRELRPHFMNEAHEYLGRYSSRTSAAEFATALNALSSVLRTSWFHRVWILQEAVLNDNTVLHMGRYEQTIVRSGWTAFINMIDLLDTLPNQQSFWEARTKLVDSTSGLQGLMKAEALVRSLSEPGATNFRILALTMCRGRGTSEARDRVYAVLGLLPETFGVVPDYEKPVEDVFREGCVAMIRETRGLLPLTQIGAVVPGLASWVPDLRQPLRDSNIGGMDTESPHVYGRSTDDFFQPYEDRPGVLAVSGVAIGVVRKVSLPLGQRWAGPELFPSPVSVRNLFKEFGQFAITCGIPSPFNGLDDVMLRTLSCDAYLDHVTNLPYRHTVDSMERLRRVVLWAHLHRDATGDAMPDSSAWADALFKAVGNVLLFCGGVCFGLGREDVEIGDVVWRLRCLPLPCVLRPRADLANGYFEFRGCCYLEGE